MATELLYEDPTGKIRQTAFDVHRYFGNGFLEKVYENALAHRLRKAGIRVEQQVPVVVRDEDGTPVGDYYADLLVEGKIVIELKAVKAFTNEHLAQLMNYLKATGYELGILANFGATTIQFKRIIMTPKSPPIVEDSSPAGGPSNG